MPNCDALLEGTMFRNVQQSLVEDSVDRPGTKLLYQVSGFILNCNFQAAGEQSHHMVAAERCRTPGVTGGGGAGSRKKAALFGQLKEGKKLPSEFASRSSRQHTANSTLHTLCGAVYGCPAY